MAAVVRIAILANAVQAKREMGSLKGELSNLATVGAALGPALIPAVGGVAVAAGALGSAFAGAGAALGVFKAVAQTALSEVQDQSKAITDLKDKATEYGQAAKLAQKAGDTEGATAALKAQSKALQDIKVKMSLLPPAQRKAVQGYIGLQGSWQKFVDANKPQVFAIFGKAFGILKAGIKELQPLFDVGANAVKKFLDAAGQWQKSGGFKALVDFLAGQAKTALPKLGTIFKNLGTAVARFFKLTSTSSGGVLDFFVKLSDKVAKFASGSGFADFIKSIQGQGPGAVDTLSNLATSVGNIAQAVAPFAPVSAAIAKSLSAIIKAIPPGVLTALVGAYVAYNTALKVNGTITTLLASKTKIVAAATKLWAIAQGLLNIAMSANPIAIVVIAVVALVAAFIIAYKKSETFRNIVNGALGKVKDVATTVFNFIKDLVIKVFDALKPVVTKFLEKAKEIWPLIQAAAKKAWDAIKTVISAAVKIIGTTIKTVVTVATTVFDGVKKVVTTSWSGIKAVIKAAVAVIKGYINIYKTVGTAVFKAVKTAASTAWSGIKSLISTAVNAIKGFVNGFKTAANNAWTAVKTGASNAWAKIKSSFSTLVSNIKSKFNEVKTKATEIYNAIKGAFSPSKLVQLGKDMIAGLVRGIKQSASSVVGAVGDVVNSAIDAAKKKLHINSPSKVFRDIGLSVNEGLVLGLKRTAAVQRASANLGNVMTKGVTGALVTGISVSSGGVRSTAPITLVANFNGVVGDPVAVGKQLDQLIGKYRRVNPRVA
jgi:phage-related protein